MTQEALKLALDALENYAWHEEACPQHPTYSEPKNYPKCICGYDKAITAIEEALAQTQEPVAVYGYCPQCGAKGVMRERRPNGNDKCANGHTYPSSTSTPPHRTEQEPDVQETLHWHAFNYRQAHTAQAHEMWEKLEQFVDSKIKAPQRNSR